MEFKLRLDALSRRLLALLQAEGRLSHAELGCRIGSSPTAIAERVRVLEADGGIQGYGAMVDPRRVGLPIMALVTLTAEGERCRKLPEAVAAHPEVLSCRRLAGEASALLEVAVPSVTALEALVGRLGAYGKTSTMLVLSTAFQFRGDPPERQPRQASETSSQPLAKHQKAGRNLHCRRSRLSTLIDIQSAQNGSASATRSPPATALSRAEFGGHSA